MTIDATLCVNKIVKREERMISHGEGRGERGEGDIIALTSASTT